MPRKRQKRGKASHGSPDKNSEKSPETSPSNRGNLEHVAVEKSGNVEHVVDAVDELKDKHQATCPVFIQVDK